MMQDRTGKDILFCEKCGEPLEKKLERPVMGIDRFHRMCLCERTRAEKQENDRKQLEHAEMVVRNRMICFSDKRMYEWTFANDDALVPKPIAIAKKYVESFGEMINKSVGLLLWGNVGTGKSYIAAAIANELIEREYTVKMTNFATIINDLFPCTDKNEYIECLMRCSLLIIDDLGVERCTEYALESVYSVIDRRYRSGKPLIVTTNLHLDDMIKEEFIEKKRIYDRVLEMCMPVQVTGESRRKRIASDKLMLLK